MACVQGDEVMCSGVFCCDFRFDGIFLGFGGFFCFFFTPTLPIDDHDGSV